MTGGGATNLRGADLNVACDDPSGRGPWMGRVIRSQHISNLKNEGYKQPNGKPTDIP
ncbi:hypothetical protein ABP06_003292 [Salmonella enterica subsp. enterica serovar Chailey]|uniref:Uncharacterized protein n=1 Tax=Salmonella enterica subsp. enterica serovar Corvallis TaxID=593905 RepID=A0A735CL69_SALET|nr:hypothetical protein [Salmonella enterica subsp. enterica serovar Chailey]EDZ0442792.1 hypothetical protein [Salmonella enterica]EEB2090753.1 hypothetical protein [Salmonella enterica subsp. enterica serovar Corvallis]EDT1975976.1 hypothetical protein [Salmonella enterica subsp. enterica serovar Chailey]EEB0366807.1 hypothetical protein [Salmonella enterica]